MKYCYIINVIIIYNIKYIFYNFFAKNRKFSYITLLNQEKQTQINYMSDHIID